MIDTTKIQQLIDDVNFAWEDGEVFIGKREIREVPVATTMFSLLMEILSELKRLNGNAEACLVTDHVPDTPDQQGRPRGVAEALSAEQDPTRAPGRRPCPAVKMGTPCGGK